MTQPKTPEALLKACRKGDSRVFRQEMERIEEVMRQRLSQGLDVTEQVAWADRVGYEYNVYLAGRNGIGEENVAKRGYGSELLAVINGRSPYQSDAPAAQAPTQPVQSAAASLLQLQNKQALEDAQASLDGIDDKYQALKNALYSDVLATRPAQAEHLADLGASKRGGLAKTEALQTAASLRQALAQLDGAMLGEVARARKEIARLEQEGQLELAKLAEEKAQQELERLARQQAELEERLLAREKLAFEKEKWQAEHGLALEKERNSYEKWLTETAADKEQSAKDEAYRLRSLTLSEQRLALDKWKAEQANQTASNKKEESAPQEGEEGSLTHDDGTPFTDEEQSYLLFLTDTIKGLKEEQILDPFTHQPTAMYTDTDIARFIMSMERFPLSLRRRALKDAHLDVDRLLYGNPSGEFSDGLKPAVPSFGQTLLENYYKKEEN